MEKSKTFCDICKISIAGNYFSKHLSSERHLRSKAAKMFYKNKQARKNPYKRFKYEDALIDSFSVDQSESQPASIIKINNQVKGVWALVKDLSNGNWIYKNKLSGKTQYNKPIGLKDEDIEKEEFESIIIDNNFYINDPVDEEIEYDEPEIGKWVDTSNSYWFGENKDDTQEDAEKVDSHEKDDSQHNSVNHISIEESKSESCEKEVVDSKDQSIGNEDFSENYTNKIQEIEDLKKQLENKDEEIEIVSKPLYSQNIQASNLFQKRKIKGKKNFDSGLF